MLIVFKIVFNINLFIELSAKMLPLNINTNSEQQLDKVNFQTFSKKKLNRAYFVYLSSVL